MNRWLVVSALLAALGTAAGPTTGLAVPGLASTPAAAQSLLDDLEIRIAPRVGAVTPADWFYEEFLHFGVDPVEWTEAFIYEAPILGLTVEARPGIPGLWIRGELLRTVGAVTSMTHAVLREASGFDPPQVVRTPYRVATALTVGTLDLALPLHFAPGPIQPYVTVGVGAKRYDFDTDPFLHLDDRVVLPQPGVVPMVNLGAGLTARVLGVSWELQLKDAMSRYWGRLQHDVMVLAGATWRVF